MEMVRRTRRKAIHRANSCRLQMPSWRGLSRFRDVFLDDDLPSWIVWQQQPVGQRCSLRSSRANRTQKRESRDPTLGQSPAVLASDWRSSSSYSNDLHDGNSDRSVPPKTNPARRSEPVLGRNKRRASRPLQLPTYLLATPPFMIEP